MTTKTLTPEKWVEREAGKWVKQMVAEFQEMKATAGTEGAIQMMYWLLGSFINEGVKLYPGVPRMQLPPDPSADDWASDELDA